MGLAASQARYLALSARKTNIEYEGQQINQQRLVLSNQSADLFNQMLTMSVPVCPDSSNYSKLQYSWNDGTNISILEDYYRLSEPNPDYNYVVTSYHFEKKYVGQRKNLSDPQVQAIKTNHFTTDKTEMEIVSKAYDAEKDIYMFDLERNGQTLAYTFKQSDQYTNPDVTEQIDAMYTGRVAQANSTDFTYDPDADTYTKNGGETYTRVDKDDPTQLKQLKDSYGGLYDSAKTYYTTGTGVNTKYICAEDVEVAKTAGEQTTVRNLDQTKYYTDGKYYLSIEEISDMTVGDNVELNFATNDPTFGNYNAIGNCELSEVSIEDFEESPEISIEINQILKADREEESRMRRERRYETLRGDVPLESGALPGGHVLPYSMSQPTFRQICRGEFDDYLNTCLFAMHDLTERAHLREIVMNLKLDHKEILFFLGIRLYSTHKLAELRGQTERNIRKVRDTVQRRIHRKLHTALIALQETGDELIHLEQDFLRDYTPAKRRHSSDEEPV